MVRREAERSSSSSTGAIDHLIDDETQPRTRALLHALLDGRPARPIGYVEVSEGVWVDWDYLATSGILLPAEIGALHLARGCAMLERAGGAPLGLVDKILETVGAVA